MEILGLVDIPLYLILALGSVVLVYLYSTWNHDFFKKRGIPGPKPYPFFGNATEAAFVMSFHTWKQIHGKVFGIFVGSEPVFVISDLEILKEVLVKSFNNFRNRRNFQLEILERSVIPELSSVVRLPTLFRRIFLIKQQLVVKPFSLSVFFMEDDSWKRVRNTISPTFSGAKLRVLCPSISDCARTLVNNFSKTFNSRKSVNMKEYFGAFTMDVIAKTAFGVDVDSQNDFNNPFVAHAKKMFAPTEALQTVRLLATVCPLLAKVLLALQISQFASSIGKFFEKNIMEMIDERKKDAGSKKTDFLQLLLDAETPDTDNNFSQLNKNQLSTQHSVRRLTTDEVVSQAMTFFIAGYETTASTLNFASYSLATNPDAQRKAYQEIKDILGDEDPTYDNISKLKYLQNVITETLRLYPPAVATDRIASETITIKGVTIPKGSTVFIPIMGIHRDPELFHDPEAFKPERHNEENNPLSFLSFGFGPRTCIGMRLALVEVKFALVHMLKKVRFEKAADTPAKFIFKRQDVLATTEPNMLRVLPRN